MSPCGWVAVVMSLLWVGSCNVPLWAGRRCDILCCYTDPDHKFRCPIRGIHSGGGARHKLIITQLNIYRHHLSTSSFPSFSLCRLSLSLCLLSLSSYSILKFYSFSFSFLIIYICCFLLRHQFVFSFSSVAFAILFSILNIFYNITFFPSPYSVADSWSTFGPGKRILPF